MKRRLTAAVAVLLLALPLAFASAQPYGTLSFSDYEAYYELASELCSDFDTDAEVLLKRVAPYYDMTTRELWDFIYYAIECDPNHVWIPAHGGTRYHRVDTCSKMKDPRPTTIDAAFDMGFTPCKKCSPPG